MQVKIVSLLFSCLLLAVCFHVLFSHCYYNQATTCGVSRQRQWLVASRRFSHSRKTPKRQQRRKSRREQIRKQLPRQRSSTHVLCAGWVYPLTLISITLNTTSFFPPASCSIGTCCIFVYWLVIYLFFLVLNRHRCPTPRLSSSILRVNTRSLRCPPSWQMCRHKRL